MNTDITKNLIERINAIPTCDQINLSANPQLELDRVLQELKEISATATALYTAKLKAIQDAMVLLKPFTSFPSPTEILSWIKNFITATFIKPYNNLALDLAQIPIEFAKVSGAIAIKIASLSSCIPNVSFSPPTMPTLEVPNVPPIVIPSAPVPSVPAAGLPSMNLSIPDPQFPSIPSASIPTPTLPSIN